MSNDAIAFHGVSKRYARLQQQPLLMRSLLTLGRDRRDHLWALTDIDLRIGHGEVVGVLGRNGAGKSTLLRLVAGVTQPTTGEVHIRGRVAPLISVGVGFYPEMSGRENIYVNGMLLGLSKEEIEERFDDIVAFSELDDFIDTPVKFYSSGMFMRLGFSVAIHTDPSIFLIDEVLAVGDIAFQLKCFERMKQIRETGTTLVVVSHNVQAIRVLCPRVVVVAHGRLEFDGDPAQAIVLHHEILSAESQQQNGPSRPGEATTVGGVAVLERSLESPAGTVTTVASGAPLRFRVRVKFEREIVDPGYYITMHDETGTLVNASQTPVLASHRTFRAGEESEIEFAFAAQLEGGMYSIDFAVVSNDAGQLHCNDQSSVRFFVDPTSWSYGIAKLDGSFSVDGAVLADDRSHRLDAAPEHSLEGM